MRKDIHMIEIERESREWAKSNMRKILFFQFTDIKSALKCMKNGVGKPLSEIKLFKQLKHTDTQKLFCAQHLFFCRYSIRSSRQRQPPQMSWIPLNNIIIGGKSY